MYVYVYCHDIFPGARMYVYIAAMVDFLLKFFVDAYLFDLGLYIRLYTSIDISLQSIYQSFSHNIIHFINIVFDNYYKLLLPSLLMYVAFW